MKTKTKVRAGLYSGAGTAGDNPLYA